jgi:hypothetical protein
MWTGVGTNVPDHDSCKTASTVFRLRAHGCVCYYRPTVGPVNPVSSTRKGVLDTYVILRRGAWGSADELGAAAERSRAVGDQQMPDDIRWIRSYVLDEGDGRLGTVCIYQASSPEAIRDHAARADLAADEIIAVADTVIVRPDPAPART